MAQVHRAVRADGRRVVVKVRRPGIERMVHRDLGVLQLLIGALEKYVPESRDLDLPAILDEFSRTIRHELDFFREASNTERLRRNLEAVDDALIPSVHWDLTSERMMVQDEVAGVSPSDPEALARAGLDPKRIARQIAKLYMKQVLDDGVFHGDLHAGNVRVTPDGRVAFLDFGAVGYLTGEMQESLGNFFLALLSQDYAAMAEEYVKLGSRESLVEERAFERDLRELIEPYFGRPMSDLRVGPILREAVIVALRHHIRLPREMILLGRSTLAVEGMIARLDPELVILEEALPQAKKLLLRRFDPRRQVRRLQRVARDYQETIRRLPNQVTRVFQRLLDSRLSIEFVHRGYEKALLEVDRASNRVSVSLIISALIVGSALIVLSGKGPMLWDFPIFGMAGFVLAAVMGFGLAIVILRSGKL